MKINYLALFGVITFNLVIFLGIAITVIALLFSLWIIVLSFVASPMLLAIVNLSGIQSFDVLQTIMSFVLLLIGVLLYPFTLKASRSLYAFFVTYIQYNKKAITR